MKKKGNISLLVLFVLVACSLLGIIAVQYIKHMAIQTSQIYNYYKTYYLAKGASEIGLSVIQHRGPGFSRNINKNDDFVKQNISTGNSFSLQISGTSNLLSQSYPNETNCNKPLKIEGGKSFILPLFTDTTGININDLFTDQKFYINKSEQLKYLTITGSTTTNNINIGIIVSSGGELNQNGIFFKTGIFQGDDFFYNLSTEINKTFESLNNPDLSQWETDNNLQNYIIIANKDSTPLEFCLKTQETQFTLPKTYITSFGYAGDKKMGLETIYQQPIPSYLIDNNNTENNENPNITAITTSEQ